MNKKIYEISYSLKQARRRFVRRVVFFVLAFFVLMNLLLSFVISPVKQGSTSMEPNIMRGTMVFATPLGKKIRRGEIVLIDSQEPLPPAKKWADIIIRAITVQKIHLWTQDSAIMRRAVALPGDSIYMKDFVLYVMPKGERHYFTEFELNQIPYSVDIRVPPTEWNTQIGVRGNFEPVTLSDDEYFVLGDNRLSSMDSRIFGKINGSSVKRRVLMSYFPIKNIKLFRKTR